MSEKHAEIYWDDQAWVLQDKGSSNGTLLNGIALVAGGEPCIWSHWLQYQPMVVGQPDI